MRRLLFAGAAVALAAISLITPGHAEDKPLIWQPSRNSDTSYAIKLGMTLPQK